MRRFALSNTPVNTVWKIKSAFLALTEEPLHNGEFCSAIPNDDQRRCVNHRPDSREELWIQFVNLASHIFVGILLSAAMHPNDLALAVNVELIEVPWVPIYFTNMANM